MIERPVQYLVVILVHLAAGAGITPVRAEEAVSGCAATTPGTDKQQVAPDRRVIESKLKLLNSILTNSATAKRIEASGDSEAIGLLHHARTNYAQAQKLLEQGCLKESETQLNTGLRTVENASHKVVDSRRNSEIARQEYEHKADRVASYREAYNRIVREKGADAGKYLDQAKLDAVVSNAHKLAQQNDYEAAHREMEKAVYLLEAALTSLRDRETLVHEWKFASVEEEYAYETATNNSYMKLLDMILHSDNPHPMRGNIEKLVKQNEDLKKTADARYAEGDVKAALGFLEQGTAGLIQALRYTGLGL